MEQWDSSQTAENDEKSSMEAELVRGEAKKVKAEEMSWDSLAKKGVPEMVEMKGTDSAALAQQGTRENTEWRVETREEADWRVAVKVALTRLVVIVVAEGRTGA